MLDTKTLLPSPKSAMLSVCCDRLRLRPIVSRLAPLSDNGEMELKILLIDDEEMICDLLGSMLSLSFDVQTTCSAREGLGLFSREHFDLVMTDLKMAEMSGEQVATEIRQLRSDQPIVFMSGHVDSATDQSLREYAPQILLEKPFPHRKEVVEILNRFAKENAIERAS